MTVNELIDGILTREGPEYVDDPADRGSPSRWGITIRHAEDYYGRPVSAEEIRYLSRDEAAAIYRHLNIEAPGFLGIVDPRVQVFVVDWGVHSGVVNVIRRVQALVGVPTDGICGAVTLAAINGWDSAVLLKELVRARMRHAIRLGLERVPNSTIRATDLKWLEGWWNRIWEVGVRPL